MRLLSIERCIAAFTPRRQASSHAAPCFSKNDQRRVFSLSSRRQRLGERRFVLLSRKVTSAAGLFIIIELRLANAGLSKFRQVSPGPY